MMPPLSYAQRGLWFLAQDGGAGAYNIALHLRLRGEVDVPALRAAFGDVIERHEVLRTVYPAIAGGPVAQVTDRTVELLVQDCAPADIDALAACAGDREFDLGSDVPVRAVLLCPGRGESLLVLVTHHIAVDGWSLAPLLGDLSTAYAARCAGKAPAFDELPVQYADYALWQGEVLGEATDPASVLAGGLRYWRAKLAGAPEELPLPCDRPRPAATRYQGGSVPFELGADVSRGVAALARSARCTVFMVLQAAVAVLLSRLGAGTDIVVGTPVAGRNDRDLEDLVGLFVNIVVLRVDLAGDPTFRELLERVRAADLEAFAHDETPFEAVVEALNPARLPGRNPLFQVSVSFQNTAGATAEFPGLEVTTLPGPEPSRAKFDLGFAFAEPSLMRRGAGSDGGIVGAVEYSAGLFDRATVESLVERLRYVLEQVLRHPDRPIGPISVVLPAEAAALERWEGATGLSGRERRHRPALAAAGTIPARFEAAAALHARKVAVTSGTRQTTYAELNARANRLARELAARGLGPEDFVAVSLERGTDLIVAILAVLKAGAAYLPVDPAYPVERIAALVADARPRAVLTSTALAAQVPAGGIPVMMVDARMPPHPAADLDDTERARPLRPDNPAYVIYTSGSTGAPKGVVVSHRNVVRLFDATRDWCRFGPDDTWALFHSVAFDFSVWELWGPLLHGGRLVVVPYDTSRDPWELLRLLATEQVTVLNQTPSAFDQLQGAEHDDPSAGARLALRLVVFGGEALRPAQLRSWYARHDAGRPELVNMYGITETTVHVTHHRIAAADVAASETASAIGHAIADLRVRVLDDRLTAVPPNVLGEVYVSGPGLARGYLGRPATTAERFVADPAGPPGARMYRSGDLARRRRDGGLEFAGRADDQVQVRGFRVEPGEVRAALAECAGVRQAVVVLREDRPGDQRLIGYVVAEPGAGVDPDGLRALLARRLPAHMQPAAVVLVPAIPLTGNGKVDRQALPEPRRPPRPTGPRPSSAAEEVLCLLFEEVLGVAGPPVGTGDGFFELGGHSLLAAQLIARVRDVLGAELRIGTLFADPTPAGIAAALRARPEEREDGAAGALAPLLALRRAGTRPPLFCVHPAAGTSWVYAGLLRYVGAGCPVYGLQAPGLAEPGREVADFGKLVDDYVSRAREVWPDGPYRLLGWSFGGLVAHAMATALQADGAEVTMLAILDAYPPNGRGSVPLRPAEALAALAESVGIPGRGGAEARTLLAERFALLGPKGLDTLVSLFGAHTSLAGQFRPRAFHGDLLVFTASGLSPASGAGGLAPASGAGGLGALWQAWGPHATGRVEGHAVAARHGELTGPDALAEIGPVVSAHLDRLDRD